MQRTYEFFRVTVKALNEVDEIATVQVVIPYSSKATDKAIAKAAAKALPETLSFIKVTKAEYFGELRAMDDKFFYEHSELIKTVDTKPTKED